MSKKVVKFEYEKETKNSVRYKEVPDEGTRTHRRYFACSEVVCW